MNPNDQLRERISDACCAAMVESWMDLEVQAEMRGYMRESIVNFVTDAVLADMRAQVGDDDEVVKTVVEIMPLLVMAPHRTAERMEREAIGQALGIGPKHGKN